jgi:hypothetical protein
MKNRFIYYLTKTEPDMLCCSGPFLPDQGTMCQGSLMVRKKQFDKGVLIHVSLHEITIEEGKTTVTVLEEHTKPPVEVLELNVAAKKKPATAKKIVIKKPTANLWVDELMDAVIQEQL